MSKKFIFISILLTILTALVSILLLSLLDAADRNGAYYNEAGISVKHPTATKESDQSAAVDVAVDAKDVTQKSPPDASSFSKVKNKISAIIPKFENAISRMVCHSLRMDGVLTVSRDANGKVIGWKCDAHDHATCTAGPDGVWKECTFPPDLMPRPDPVPKEILSNPPLK